VPEQDPYKFDFHQAAAGIVGGLAVAQIVILILRDAHLPLIMWIGLNGQDVCGGLVITIVVFLLLCMHIELKRQGKR
jgi:hypothetical protein